MFTREVTAVQSEFVIEDSRSRSAPPADDIRAELERILSSPDLHASDRRRAFLRYVVEETLSGRADRLKGYTVATAVFGRDVVRALAVARQIDSGICHVNAATVHDEPQMPFGGVKASGYGRFGGTAAIDEFTELRWITVQGEPAHYPF